MKNKKIITLILVVSIALIFINNLLKEDANTTSNPAVDRIPNPVVEEPNNKLVSSDNTQPELNLSQPEPDYTTSETHDIFPIAELVIPPVDDSDDLITAIEYCSGYEQLKFDSQVELFKTWSEENIFYDYTRLKPYGYYSANELAALVEQNDHLAMYAQGLNYSWQTKHNSTTHRKLRYEGDNDYEYERKDYDHSMAEQAKSALFSAASKYPSALFEMLDVILIQLFHDDTRRQKDKSQRLFIQLLATFQFLNYAIPDLNPVTSERKQSYLSFLERYNSNLRVSNIDEHKLEQIKNNLVKSWQAQRASHNLIEIHDFETPFDHNILNGLNKSITVMICDANANNPEAKFRLKHNNGIN
jgi:hypothetical protein